MLALASASPPFYTDLLWFRSVGLSSVWTKTITVEAGLGATFCVVFFGLLWGNLWLADRLAPSAVLASPGDELVARWQQLAANHMKWIRLVVAILFALIGGVSAHAQWNNWLLFSNAAPFTTASAPWKNGLDPLNHLNDGFYVFRLPFLDWVVGWAFSALVVTLLLCLVAHYLNGGIRPGSPVQRVSPRVKAHLSVLLAVLALVQGVNYYLQRLSLVLSTKYVVDGPTYTVVHAVRPALVLLVAISVIAAALFLYNVRQQGWLLPVVAVALWAIVWALVANVYPALVQALVVNPAENVKEAPYIQDNITATTFAYGLQNVTTPTLPGQRPHHRLRGHREVPDRSGQPAEPRQRPAPRPHHHGLDVHQGAGVPWLLQHERAEQRPLRPCPAAGRAAQRDPGADLGPRAQQAGVPSNWVNQHLQYTHGYGAVVAPANQEGVGSSGYPSFTLSGVPPTGQPSLSAQPRVYFDDNSQSTSGYVIANSAEAELDYEDPNTGAQISNHYDGTGGVAVGGFLRRLAFAVSFGDYNILISGQVTPQAKIMYFRNVVQRVEKAAPFLSYDSDPYPVALNGRLYWVVDAYTTTDNFPGSEQADVSRVAQTSGL